MIKAGHHFDLNEVRNEGKDEEIPGRRSIERAIEESLAMKMKCTGFETKVDDVISWKPGRGKTIINSNNDEISLSNAIEEDFQVENSHKNDLLQEGRGRSGAEIKINNICKGYGVKYCLGEISEMTGSNSVQMLQKSPHHGELTDLMVGVEDHQSRNPGTANQHSTDEATPLEVAKKLNLEKLDSELEAYILDKLSLLQPSFRTLFEPGVVSGTSSGCCDSDDKTGPEAAAVSGKSKWKKKIEGVIAKVKSTTWSAKKHQQPPDLEAILHEKYIKGILKMRWEEEKEKSQMKEKERWRKTCICCPRTNSTGEDMKDWEFQLDEYSSTW